LAAELLRAAVLCMPLDEIRNSSGPKIDGSL